MTASARINRYIRSVKTTFRVVALVCTGKQAVFDRFLPAIALQNRVQTTLTDLPCQLGASRCSTVACSVIERRNMLASTNSG
jgi:hypothetical protein